MATRASDVLDVADTLYRFGQGIDENDGDLLQSVFTEDAVVDIATSLAEKFGVQRPILTGREMIVDVLQKGVGRLTTTHLVLNQRIEVSGDRATLRAIVQAMHLVPGDAGRRGQTTSVHTDELVRTSEGWQVGKMVVDVVWIEGDLAVITGA